MVHPILTWTPTPIPAQPGPAGSQPCTSPQNLQLDVLHLVQHPPDVLLELLGVREGKAGPPTPLPPPSPLILWVLPLGTYQEPGGLVVQGHVYFGHAVPHLVEGGDWVTPQGAGPMQDARHRWLPQRPLPPLQVGTSVMAIFFLSKDSRICCSSFWGKAQCGQREGWRVVSSFLPARPRPPGPTWDCCMKDSFPRHSSCCSSCRGALSFRGRALACSRGCRGATSSAPRPSAASVVKDCLGVG